MKVLLGMPTVGKIPTKTVISLLQTVERGKVEPILVDGSLVYDSRTEIAAFAVQNGYDYVLYADSDMIFCADDLRKLLDHDADIVSGLYITRRGERKNVAYTKVIPCRKFPYRSPALIHDDLNHGYAEIAAVGFGFCLIKTEVIKTMLKRYKNLFEPFKGLGEDISFCERAKKCGFRIMIDRDVKLGHIGEMINEP